MGYNYQPAEITNFAGGMTDDYVNGPLTMAEKMENLYVLENKAAKTRPGTLLDSETDAQIPAGTQRINTLMSYNHGEKLFAHSAKRLYYRNPVSWATLFGPTGNNPFNLADANTNLAQTQWNRHLVICSEAFDKPVKVYRDNSSTYQVRTAGLPALASSPTVTMTAGANAYLYAFHYSYTYMIGDQTFIDKGPVTIVSKESVTAPNSSAANISVIPVLSNASGDNYETTVIKIEIFRTINGGREFYKLGEVTNGTTVYVDNLSDTLLQDNEPIYTSGDVPDNDPPPLAKFCHTVNDVTYYAYIKEGSEIFPNRIKQSQAEDPDSVPGSFEHELEDEVTGISSTQDIPIVGCKKHIYRIEGAFDEVGRGGMEHRRISDHAGCVSHESMVQTDVGLFWFGVDGIYYTEGYKVRKVTNHLNKRYANFLATLVGKNRKIKGIFDDVDRVVHWTVSTTSKATGQEDCDSLWILDLKEGLSDAMSCRLWVGGDTFFPSTICFHNATLYRADKTGYVLYFDENSLTDPKIDAGQPVAGWAEETIIWRWRSIATNFGTSFVRKTANRILLSCKNETNVSIAISAVNDDGRITRNIKPIRWRRNFTWGDEEFVWGDPNCVWYYGGTLEVDRRFPAGGLRFNYLQIEITNDFTNIVNSDLNGNAVVNSTLKTVTLVDSVDTDWPSQAVDYYILFESDNYTRQYKVIARTADTLTVEDGANTLLDGTFKWQMKGYKKGEVINLVGLNISWALISRSYDTYNKGDDGGLAE